MKGILPQSIMMSIKKHHDEFMSDLHLAVGRG